jgi:hypothetical protein
MASPAFPIQPADIARISFRAARAESNLMIACLTIANLMISGCAAIPEAELSPPPSQIALGSTGTMEATQSPSVEPPALTEQQQRHVQVFSATLLSASADIDAETRRSAAQELLAMNRAESLQALDQALRSRTPAVMLAAIGAMQSAKPAPALLEPAVAALDNAPLSVIEPLSWVIARYGEAAVSMLSPLATEQASTVSARLGPIRALGAFDSQSAAAALMQILHRDNEPAELINAACESLQRLTGLSHNADVRPWRAWWAQARDLPADEWSAFINQSLSKRAAQLQQDLQRQREASDRIARELFNAYRDLYPTLPVDEQLRRLTALMQDPLPPLREFAISRVALLLRDSVRIPLEVQQKLAERLNDDVPALRIEAAKLLDELNHEPIGALLAARVNIEQTPAAVSAFLDVLSRRPCLDVVEPARRWLADANLGARAANAIWRALQSETVSADQITKLCHDLRSALEQREFPAAVRVLALIGDNQDVARLTQGLDGDDPAIRAAIAEGFCQRGLRQPLIERAADPAVFPFAVRALLEGTPDVAALRRLIAITPAESHEQVWLEACVKLCEAISPQDLLAADDLLLASPSVDTMVRLALLQRATLLPREELSREHRAALIARYAPFLIEQGESAKAHALLESIGCNAPQVSELCFQAAALSGNYDKASQLHETAAAWIGLLVDVANRDLVQAGPLFNEITRRFQGRLQDHEQKDLDRVARLLRDAAASASAAGLDFALPR